MEEITNKHLDYPDEVVMLVESMWLRHLLDIPQRGNNVFIVDLPPLSDAEKRKYRSSEKADFVDEGEGVDYWTV